MINEAAFLFYSVDLRVDFSFKDRYENKKCLFKYRIPSSLFFQPESKGVKSLRSMQTLFSCTC